MLQEGTSAHPSSRRVSARLILDVSAAQPSKPQLSWLTSKELLDEVNDAELQLASAEGRLRVRDVRKIDPSFSESEPVILVRSGAIVVAIGKLELRAVITRRRLYFSVPDGGDSVLIVVRENLEKALAADPHVEGTPFEFAALEALLMTANAELLRQKEALIHRSKGALASLQQAPAARARRAPAARARRVRPPRAVGHARASAPRRLAFTAAASSAG